MRAQVKDEVTKLLQGKIANGYVSVLSDYGKGQRIVLEFYGTTQEEEKECYNLVKEKYPNATVYTTNEENR